MDKTRLNQLIRRALQSQEKSPLRKQALDAMLIHVKSPDPEIREICTKSLHRFINSFPDLKEKCIDSVYDACEDPISDVRKAGYSAIALFSGEDHSLVRRNTDVLVQLLQSDDLSELNVIKQSLENHLKIDAAASLQVLCDSCSPGSDFAAEDPADREQLRNLVLEFLTGNMRIGVRTTLNAADDPASRVLIIGLCKAIPLCTDKQVNDIVNLFTGIRTVAHSKELSDTLIDALERNYDRRFARLRGKIVSRSDVSSLVELSKSGKIVVKTFDCNPLPIFTRLSSVLDQKNLTDPPWRPDEARTYLKNVFEIAAGEISNNSVGWNDPMNELADKSAQLLPTMLLDPIMWQEIGILLKSILDVSCFIDMLRAFPIQRSSNPGWVLSQPLFDCLRKIEAEIGNGGASPLKDQCSFQVKKLIPPIGPANERQSQPSLSFVNAAQSSQKSTRTVAPTKRKHSDDSPVEGSFGRPYPSLASRMGMQYASQPAVERTRTMSSEQPSYKKIKENPSPISPNGSSLLARMNNGSKPTKVDISSNQGFNIKGAASSPSTRLQERLK